MGGRPAAAAAPLPRLRLATALILGALVHVAIWQISEPPTLFSDFYKAYFPAAEHVLEHGWGASWPFTEAGAGGFINLPVIVVLFLPFVLMTEEAAGWVFLGLGLAAVLLTFRLLARVAGARPGTGPWIAIALLMSVNGPLVNSLREGNVTHFILLLLVLSVLLLRAGKPRLAGGLIGFCGILKLPLLLLLALLVWRRRWAAVSGALGTIVVVLAASLAAFGLEAHIDWFKTSVLPFLTGVIPAFNVQSIDGFLVRLVTGAQLLRDWDPIPRSIPHNVGRALLLLGLVGAAFAVLRRPASGLRAPPGSIAGDPNEYELAIVLMLAIVCSPVAWTHYYLLMLLPWAMVVRGLLAGTFDRRARALILASMALASLPVLDVPDVQPIMREIWARSLISAWLFGGLALIAALLMLRSRQASPETGLAACVAAPSIARTDALLAREAEHKPISPAPRPGSGP